MPAKQSPGDVDRAAMFDLVASNSLVLFATRFPSRASWLLPSSCSSVGRGPVMRKCLLSDRDGLSMPSAVEQTTWRRTGDASAFCDLLVAQPKADRSDAKRSPHLLISVAALDLVLVTGLTYPLTAYAEASFFEHASLLSKTPPPQRLTRAAAFLASTLLLLLLLLPLPLLLASSVRPPFHSFNGSLGRCPQRRPQRKQFKLAAETLPTVHNPHVHYPHRFQSALTPPYSNDPKPYLDDSAAPIPSSYPQEDRSWSNHHGQRGFDGQLLMSRHTAPGSQSSAVDDASRRLQHAAPQTSPAQSFPGMNPYPRHSPNDGPAQHSVSLPPLRHLSNTPPTPSSDRRSGNPLGVQSILNPQAELAEQQRGRQRSGSQMESPSPVETQPPPSLPSISRPTSVDSQQEDSLPARPFHPPGRPLGRHMLSPRSPTIHRTQSLSVLNPPTGTIDAHQSPFLSPSTRPFGTDPVTSQPALPTPPVAQRPGYFPPVPATVPTPPPNVVRGELRRPSAGFPQSGTASPISYSPYSQPASVASSQFETSSQQGSYMPPSNSGQRPDYNPSIAMETERGLIPMQPSSQSTIQMMTIKSQQGHQVQIPVDVQAASKVADEKRKRNAGASARFRARRKEKEREASMSITRLEQQLRETIEDMDYYRNERDYFKSIVFAQPGAERHYARPPSPRLRRSSAAPSNAASSTGGGGSGDSSFSGFDELDNARESERNVRRRTSSYHPVPGPPPEQSNGSGPHPQSYAAQAFPPINQQPPTGHHPHRGLPPQQIDAREQRPLPELQPPAVQRPILRDPFASDANRYDNRNWPPGPNRDPRS